MISCAFVNAPKEGHLVAFDDDVYALYVFCKWVVVENGIIGQLFHDHSDWVFIHLFHSFHSLD